MKKLCCIFGAGTYYGHERPPACAFLAVTADGGYPAAQRLGVRPDIHVGDFDSLNVPVQAGEIIRLRSEKADTDTLAAIRVAIERGCDAFLLYGCTGGRTAHTVANVQTLAMLAERGLPAWMHGDHEIFTCVHDGKRTFSAASAGYISVFSLSEKSRGVFERGLKYELEDAEMTNTFPYGVSNEFIGERAEIGARDGTLLLIYTDRATEEDKPQ